MAGKSCSSKLLFNGAVTSFDRFHEIQRQLPERTSLLAVSKGHRAAAIRSLASHGHCDFGESRLQEAIPKMNELSDITKIRWHFIGHLQANKVRSVVQKFDVIHSLDSLKLAQRVSRIAGEEGKSPIVMAQVKFRIDPNKSGFSESELLEAWFDLVKLPNIHLVGLMTIAPIMLDLNQRKTLFKQCRDLADKLDLKECSMGMSADWKEALAAGATWVRIGSGLFGERHK